MGNVGAPRKGQHPTLADLKSASTPALRQLYTEYVGNPPSGRASAEFLRSNIAWTVQALVTNKDPAALRKALLDAVHAPLPSKRTQYKPGTRLIREWQGEVHAAQDDSGPPPNRWFRLWTGSARSTAPSLYVSPRRK